MCHDFYVISKEGFEIFVILLTMVFIVRQVLVQYVGLVSLSNCKHSIGHFYFFLWEIS